MSSLKAAMVLLVAGCGLGAFFTFMHVHHSHGGLDAGLPLPGLSVLEAQEVERRLSEFPTKVSALERRLLSLERGIVGLQQNASAVDGAGAELRRAGAASSAASGPASSLGAGGSAARIASTGSVGSTGSTNTGGSSVRAASVAQKATPVPPASVESSGAIKNQEKVLMRALSKWREDSKCGRHQGNAECNPQGEFPCCSNLGWCGNSKGHCECGDCVDYRVGDSQVSSATSVGEASMAQSPPVPKSTIVVIIPFRDRESHLAKFKDYWRWFAAEGRKPKTVTRWEFYVIEQFDARTFNRGWTFNVGLAIASGQVSASSDINRSALDFGCAVIQDIDYLPEAGVNYAECAVPMQLSGEIDRFGWKTPYLQNAGGIVSMSLTHWRAINGFSNEYYGWGGEDDELFQRLHLNKLLMGDCYPFCKTNDPSAGRIGQSIKRPPKGYGRFSGKYMHSSNHTKRITDSKAYDANLKLLSDIKRGSSRWKNDGLSNLAFRVVYNEVDAKDAETSGITYHHVKVHRGEEAFDLGKLSLAVPASLCSSSTTAGARGWTLAVLGKDTPWDLDALRTRTLAQAQQDGGSGCSAALSATFILVDRRRHLAKLFGNAAEDDRLLVTFYRSLDNPAEDGMIIADPRSPTDIKQAFVTAGAFLSPPSEYSVCQSKLANGAKYSIHDSAHCGGGGWDLVPGALFHAYTQPGAGLKAISWCDNTQYWTQRIVQGEVCPVTWANLKWTIGGTMWVPKGDTFCVGTREGASTELSFSRSLPRARCEGDGFRHEFTFGGAVEEKRGKFAGPLTLSLCRKTYSDDGGAIISKVSFDPSACEAVGWRPLARILAREAAAALPGDRVLCVKRLPGGNAGDELREASECPGDTGWKLKFAVPGDSARAPSRVPLQRMRFCWGASASSGFSTLGYGHVECLAHPVQMSFEAPAALDVAASTPAGGEESAPLYALVEEARACFGFMCPGTLRPGALAK